MKSKLIEKTCPKCNGSGQVPKTVDPTDPSLTDCPQCDGFGHTAEPYEREFEPDEMLDDDA